MKYALVIVDVSPLHLDHAFTYSIPDELVERVTTGSRVRVTFHGRKLIGYVIGVSNSSDRKDRISPLLDALCDVPVLTGSVATLTKAVSHRWVGAWVDVIKSAVPPRHIKTEEAVFSELALTASVDVEKLQPSQSWSHYLDGHEVLDSFALSHTSRAAMVVAPGDDTLVMALDVALTVIKAGRNAIIEVADAKELARLKKLAIKSLSRDAVAVLSGDDGAGVRYKNFLRTLRGEVRLVVGTRNAVFAPLSNLGVVVVCDDSDSGHAEIRTPSWHAREVAWMRSHQEATHFFVVAHSRSTQVQRLVEAGECRDVVADSDFVSSNAPKIRATDSDELSKDPLARFVRIPSQAFSVMRDALREGPVLVQVPRRGYQLHLSCSRCRESARCPECNGPMARASQSGPMNCMRCGHVTGSFQCPWCQATQVRSSKLGSIRTAEEFGRAFPDTIIRTSGKDNILEEVPNESALIIATPGAQPRVLGGYYKAAIILDADATLMYSYLSAHEDALHRWSDVAALVEPKSGKVVVVGDDAHHVIQAFIKHDSIGFASKELAQRAAASMTPAVSTSEVFCSIGAWNAAAAPLPKSARVLGPIAAVRDGKKVERVLISTPWSDAPETSNGLRAAAVKSQLAKRSDEFDISVDPTILY